VVRGTSSRRPARSASVGTTPKRRCALRICSGRKTIGEIESALSGDQSGRISEYLSELGLAGFIARDYTWNLKSGDDAKISQFRSKGRAKAFRYGSSPITLGVALYVVYALRTTVVRTRRCNRPAYYLSRLAWIRSWSSLYF